MSLIKGLVKMIFKKWNFKRPSYTGWLTKTLVILKMNNNNNDNNE